jgi:hypothetical protein
MRAVVDTGRRINRDAGLIYAAVSPPVSAEDGPACRVTSKRRLRSALSVHRRRMQSTTGS